MTLGGVASTVAVTADVVAVLPALSVAVTVKLWLPLGSTAVTKPQLRGPSTLKVAVPKKVAPS